MAILVDTNILVYRFDPRFPEKQAIATELLGRDIDEDTVRIPHQALVEFVAAITRGGGAGRPLLSFQQAHREAEDLVAQFPVLYPTGGVFRAALRGAAAYQLSWFDAHLWAYADYYGLGGLVSEDFQHDRLYGAVRVHNPFLVA